MTTNERYITLARITRRGVALVGLLVLSVGWICDVHAGSSVAGAKTQGKVATATRLPVKGAHEGIGVHGHWTIDVKNPDGTLARRVEFENGLCVGSGDQLVAQLLTGGATLGGWEIRLGGPSIPSGAATAAACSDLEPANSAVTIFVLEQSNDANSTTGVCAETNAAIPTQYCFPSLTPPPTGGSTVTLAAQFTVPAGIGSTQITGVGTALFTCLPSFTVNQCVSNARGAGSDFTGAYLTGVAPMPPPLTVVAGQSVSVNVQLSFH